jgi:hypothetical protein
MIHLSGHIDGIIIYQSKSPRGTTMLKGELA